jgi:hypothetical protein
MYLTQEEELMLNGEMGETLQMCMEMLVALGELYGAERLIDVKSVQISGVSYKTIGEAGLMWLSNLEGRVKVPSMLNPAGMDLQRWEEMGISHDFASKQLEIVRKFAEIGVEITCTCTPYYHHEIKMGDHLAWSESSAVCYANSVIGARTNREGGPSAIASALTGKTPLYGLHLDENRVPDVKIIVEGGLSGTDYGALGYVVGELICEMDKKIPIFTTTGNPTDDELKLLGASLAATGSVALYHVEGITPEAKQVSGLDEIVIESSEIKEMYGVDKEPDLVAFGCPHCSENELKEIERMLKGRKVKRETWIFASRKVIEDNKKVVESIEKSGVKVFADTCMVVSPLCENFSCILVNSGKAYRYVRTLCGLESILLPTQECIEWACRPSS